MQTLHEGNVSHNHFTPSILVFTHNGRIIYRYIQPVGWFIVINIFLRCPFQSLVPAARLKAPCHHGGGEVCDSAWPCPELPASVGLQGGTDAASG